MHNDAGFPFYFSEKDKFTFGTKKNIIILVVDCMGEEVLKEMFEHFPELRRTLQDFTCFDGMRSSPPRTLYAVPTLLTGIDFSLSRKPLPAPEEFGAFLERVCKSETSLLRLAKVKRFRVEGYPAAIQTICCTPDLLDNCAVSTIIPGEETVPVPPESFRDRLFYFFLKLFFFRESPAETIPRLPGSDEADLAPALSEDHIFFRKLQQEFCVGKNKRVFKYFHLYGAHDPVTLDEHLNSRPHTLRYQQLRGTFKIIELLLKKLRKHRIYHSSTIVITGNHSESYTSETVTFIKRPFEIKKELLVNSYPCNITQIAGTVARSAGLAPMARTLFDCPFRPGSLTVRLKNRSPYPDFSPWKKSGQEETGPAEYELLCGNRQIRGKNILLELAAQNPLLKKKKIFVTAVNLFSSECYVSSADIAEPFRDLLLPELALPEGYYLIYISGAAFQGEKDRTRYVVSGWFRVRKNKVTSPEHLPPALYKSVLLNKEMFCHCFAYYPGVEFPPRSAAKKNGIILPEKEPLLLRLPDEHKKYKVAICFAPMLLPVNRTLLTVNGKPRGELEHTGKEPDCGVFTFSVQPREKKLLEILFLSEKNGTKHKMPGFTHRQRFKIISVTVTEEEAIVS